MILIFGSIFSLVLFIQSPGLGIVAFILTLIAGIAFKTVAYLLIVYLIITLLFFGNLRIFDYIQLREGDGIETLGRFWQNITDSPVGNTLRSENQLRELGN